MEHSWCCSSFNVSSAPKNGHRFLYSLLSPRISLFVADAERCAPLNRGSRYNYTNRPLLPSAPGILLNALAACRARGKFLLLWNTVSGWPARQLAPWKGKNFHYRRIFPEKWNYFNYPPTPRSHRSGPHSARAPSNGMAVMFHLPSLDLPARS